MMFFCVESYSVELPKFDTKYDIIRVDIDVGYAFSQIAGIENILLDSGKERLSLLYDRIKSGRKSEI